MTDSMIRFVGLDVHKRVVEACIVDQAGNVVHRERFALNRHVLGLFATKVLRPGDHVALEASTNCWAVADLLRPHVARVVVSNPMTTKAIAQAKVKTDKVDAYVLAQLLRCDFLPEVWQPDEATRRLRELTGRRATLVGHRTAMRNRIHSVLAMRLVEAPERLFTTASLQWLDDVELDEQGQTLVDSDRRLLAFVQGEIDAIDLELARRGHDSPQVKLLITLPGVDVTTAEAVVAAWGDIRRFPDADHAASYLGLASSTKQSANRCYHGPITKQGNSQARWMLIEAAQHLDKHPGPLGHFFRRLLRKKCRNVAVVAGARKLAMIAWLMLAHEEPYRYAVPQSTEAKLAKLRVKATGKRRVGGVAKGQKVVATRPGHAGGTRRIRALSEVCEVEGLPAPKPLSSGEQRTVRSADCETFVKTIAEQQLVDRRSTRKSAQAGDHDSTAPQATAAPAGPASKAMAAGKEVTTGTPGASPTRAASCPVRIRTLRSGNPFRPHPACEQGDEAPPPAPPTLFSVPKQGRTKEKSQVRR
ncbi:MAG: IS110 family transposase [Phycisphaerae bacterium]|nr:IS110 family transposase [Phycisphaerae bacterium]